MKWLTMGIALFITSASWGSTLCRGSVTAVFIGATGSVHATISNESGSVSLSSVNFCSVSVQEGEYTTDACKLLFSLFSMAHVAQKSVQLWYSSEDFSCSPSWGKASLNGFYLARAND